MRKGMNVAIIATLAMAVLMFVIMAVILSVGASIQSGVRQTQCTLYNESTGDCVNASMSTIASNITTSAMSGTENIGNQLPLIGTIIAFGAVIGLLLAVFYFRGKGRGGF